MVCALVLALAVSTMSAAVGPRPARAATRNYYRGTWVLQEAATVTQLNRHATAIRAALRLNGVIGLSIRVPWKALEPRKGVYDFRVLKRAREIAGEEKLAIRFMAGRFTPSFRMGHSMVYNGSSTGGRGKGSVVPLAFGRNGGPNEEFERGWQKMVDRLVYWGKRHRVRLVHLSWPGLLWAELALVDQMKKQPGYSYKAALNTHLRMLSYGLKKTTERVFIEFATTGHAPNELRMAIHNRLLASPLTNRCFFQANNVSPEGWGLPSQPPPPKRGAQMVSGGNKYDWREVYDAVRGMYATYLEVYTTSFSGGTAAELKYHASRFA